MLPTTREFHLEFKRYALEVLPTLFTTPFRTFRSWITPLRKEKWIENLSYFPLKENFQTFTKLKSSVGVSHISVITIR